MSASDFALPAELEALVIEACRREGVRSGREDEIRALVSSPVERWPACCGAACRPCVEDQKSLAREILARWRSRVGSRA